MTTITMEEYELMKDSKYRMYVAAVDKALKTFELSSEWADLIAALGKLNKVLLSYTKFPVIPRRIKISKRLAQCMHPALPSGVHLKALETYDIIFKSMGTNRLSLELFIYSAGLFPLLGHAAMNIRPSLLNVYDTHFVPLRERLRPALSGFLSGVLPGLETGSDYFDRTNTLLENVCEGVGPSWFYTCIWQCVKSNSPVRLPAISYVLSHYSRKVSMEDQLYLMGNDIDVMVSGLCAAVYDSSILVQRSALDLLMVCFPMNNTQLLYADMVRLVMAALTTILRRDMSLNRRLYSWLLCADVNAHMSIIDTEETEISETQNNSIAYDLMLEALKIILKEKSTEQSINVVPYRLLTSLFEKPQIGPVILDHILYEVFRSLYLTCLHQQKQRNASVRCVSFNGDLTSLKQREETTLTKQFITKYCQELVKNANLLFATLQPYYIWAYLEKCFEKAAINLKNVTRNKLAVNDIGSGEPCLVEICILSEFLLDIIPIEIYDENTHDILPSLFMKILVVLERNIEILNRNEITTSLQLCTKILMKIQPITVKQPLIKPEVDVKLVEEIHADSVDSSTTSEKDKEIKPGLEKSKSDSKINENLNKNELSVEDKARERSNSNQMSKKKDKNSPKIDKKSKNKKSKSSSKLYELKKDEDEEKSSENVLEFVENVLVVEQQLPETPTIENNIKFENKHIISCWQIYKDFFVTFIRHKIISGLCVESHFNTLICDKENRTKHLEAILTKCLESYTSMNRHDFSCTSTEVEYKYDNLSNGSEYDEAMTVACNILLEFAAFPNMLNNAEQETNIPFWLKVLIASACTRKACKDVQLIAMNALLEIFSLAKSQHYQKKQEEGNTNVIITGILESAHVNYIEENTLVLKVMCEILWWLLGTLSNQNQIMLCVTLLYQLHNIFNKKSIVEDVIGHYLIDENLNTEHLKKFTLLLHLGRDLNIKLPAYQCTVRNFDKCLLKIFDNLQNTENANIKLLAETFLTHSLLRNDMARILNPILLKLLAPSTSRISIQKISIQDSELQANNGDKDSNKIDDAKAKKIFAISNVNGNVMYHVTDTPSPKPQKRKWYLFNKGFKKYNQVINTTTSISENSSVITKKSKEYKHFEVTSVSDKNRNNVKLFINPLSSKEIYPNGIDGSYVQLDPHNSQESSNESLSSPDLTQSSNEDSLLSKQYEHQTSRTSESSKNILEHIETISNGVKDSKPTNKLSKSQSFDEKANEKLVEIENLSLVHSWSYSISDSDNLNAELEMSTSAEDFFKDSDNKVVKDVLNEILIKVCGEEEEICDSPNTRRSFDAEIRNSDCYKNVCLYPMHQHMCLYCEIFDLNHILYALKTLKNCLVANPQLFIKCLATTGLKDLNNNEILILLARHYKSTLGLNFSGDLNQEYLNTYRGYMFLDVVIIICLNYARSFFWDPIISEEEIYNNLQIQLKSLEILDLIVKNLITIVSENRKGFAVYIADMLLKCKLQGVVLHCLLTSVRNFDKEMTFAEEVLLFNNFKLYDSHKKVSEHVEAFQIQLLRLIQSLIILEYQVFSMHEAAANIQQTIVPNSGDNSTYSPTILIPQQNMFLSAVLSALRHKNMKNLHQNWCNMITSCLPYFGDNLKQICTSVIHNICNNIEIIADTYKNTELPGELSADYATTQLESLTILCHYCLLDSSQTVNQNIPANMNTQVTNSSEIFNNLMNVFFSPIGLDSTFSKQNTDSYQNVRKVILSHMPRIIASVAKLWQTIVGIEGNYYGIYGNSKVVRQQLMEFLSPISIHHSASFLAAVAVAWHERRNPFSNVKTILVEPNSSQNNLVYLISAIRVIPLDNLVQTVIAVIKNPPPIEGLSSDVLLDVCVLELFYCYMRNASTTQLSEAWGSLLTLIREGCSLGPQSQFLVAAILNEIMIKCCPLEERKDQKDLQDVTAKLIECVSQVCGSCLEQTTWLRRNLAVREQDEDSISSVSVVTTSNSDILMGLNNNYSVQAQLVLSEILAPILDICFGSSEKDKVNTILTSLMCNIVPYLKTHTVRNMPSFNACSKLLSSLSSYQYTRKAWKKDVFDLVLDNNLFQMDYSCLKYWKIIVDHLMTHDNTTFKDLMSRVSMTQSGSLSLFSSREQELEQRAQLLKRLAFVIFCSETDQYAKYMPDIQEQLTSSLRLNVPNVQAQVFLCFRVLLLRMSPLQITSLWPIIISEMLQVFIQIEQQLSTETDEFRNNTSSHLKLLSTLDPSWATNSNNGLHAFGNPHWLQLQLSTAKLLDLTLLLPATALPQFQMYRWAFVEDDISQVTHQGDGRKSNFTPHVTRISNLMDEKFKDLPIETMPTKQNELLLTVNNITQLKELHPFFKTLSLCSNRHRTDCNGIICMEQWTNKTEHKKMQSILEKIDRIIENDFLDKIPR
nr:protein dopey-1 homolog isoform X1 [Onthophagus taurus]